MMMRKISAGTLALVMVSFASAAVAGPYPWDFRLTYPAPADVQVARATTPAPMPDTCLELAPKAGADKATCGKVPAARGKAMKSPTGG